MIDTDLDRLVLIFFAKFFFLKLFVMRIGVESCRNHVSSPFISRDMMQKPIEAEFCI